MNDYMVGISEETIHPDAYLEAKKNIPAGAMSRDGDITHQK